MDLDKIRNYEQLKETIDDTCWQKFEEIVGKIFELHEYDVEVSKVVTFEDTKRQYDVLAKKDYWVITDCKKWDNKRRIKHGLKKAAEDQIERVRRLNLEEEAYPVVVVSSQSPIEFHSSVPIVSIYKLNEFLSEFDGYQREIMSL